MRPRVGPRGMPPGFATIGTTRRRPPRRSASPRSFMARRTSSSRVSVRPLSWSSTLWRSLLHAGLGECYRPRGPGRLVRAPDLVHARTHIGRYVQSSGATLRWARTTKANTKLSVGCSCSSEAQLAEHHSSPEEAIRSIQHTTLLRACAGAVDLHRHHGVSKHKRGT